MSKNMPLILIGIVILLLLIDPFIPLSIKQFLYTISLTVKSVIVFALPFIVFGLLFRAMITLTSSASRMIILILILVCCSNFITTFISYFIGSLIYNFDLSLMLPDEIKSLTPLYVLEFPNLIANDKAMFAGIIIGLIAAKFCPKQGQKFSLKIEKFINFFLKIITYMIPFFVAGFVVKLKYDGSINLIIKDYPKIFAVIILAQFSYITFIYFILNGSNKFFQSLKNMIPAAISGFCTMSSAASMPLTIIGVENNSKNKILARSVIPVTVNIHLIGDCLAIPILAFALLKSFGVEEPSLYNYLIFTLYFVMAKFSVAAIPGGGIIVMLTILQSNLGFNSDMLSLITALYIIFDPIITSANIFGNGAFAKLIDNIYNRFSKANKL